MADGTIKIAVDLDAESLEQSLGKIAEVADKVLISAGKNAGKSFDGLNQSIGNGAGAMHTLGVNSKSAGTVISKSANAAKRGFSQVIDKADLLGNKSKAVGTAVEKNIETPLLNVAKTGISSIDNFSDSISKELLGAIQNIQTGIFDFHYDFGQFMEEIQAFISVAMPEAETATDQFTKKIGNLSSLVGLASGIKGLTGIMGESAGAAGLFGKAVAVFPEIAVGATATIGTLVGGMALYIKATEKHLGTDKELLEIYQRLSGETQKTCAENDKFVQSLQKGRTARKEQVLDAEAAAASSTALADQLFKLADKHNKTNEEIKTMQGLVDGLNKSIPGLNLKFDEETGSLNMTRDAVLEVIEAKKQMAKQDAIQQLMTQSYKDQFKAEAELQKLYKERAKIKREIEGLTKNIPRTKNKFGVTTFTPSEAQKTVLRDLETKISDVNGRILDTQTQVVGLVNDSSSYADVLQSTYGKVAETAGISRESIVAEFEGSTTNIQAKAKAIYDSMLASGSQYGQSYIDAWKAAMDSGVPGIYDSVEAFATIVKNIMDFSPEAGQAGSEIGQMYSDSMGLYFAALPGTTEEQANKIVNSLDKTAEAGEKGAKTGESYTNNIECEIKAAPEITDAASSEAAGKLDKSGEAGQAGANTAAAFATGLSQGKSQAAQAFQGVLEGLRAGGSLEKFAADMRGYGYDSLAKLAAGMGESEDMIAKKLSDVSGMTVETVKNLFAQEGAQQASNSAKAMMSSTGTAIEQEGQTVIVRAANVGKNIALGIATGIGVGTPFVVSAARNAVNQAVQAAKAAGDIHSPSRVFRDQVGKMLTAGIVVGIEQTSEGVAEAMAQTVEETVARSEKAAEIGGRVGALLMDNTAAGIQKNSEGALEKFNGFYDKLETRRDFDLISEREYYEQLRVITDKYLAHGSKEWLEYTKKVYDYEQKMVEEHKDAVKSLYDEMADYAKERQDEVLDLQADMEKKLKNYGSLYDTTEYNMFGQKVNMAA